MQLLNNEHLNLNVQIRKSAVKTVFFAFLLHNNTQVKYVNICQPEPETGLLNQMQPSGQRIQSGF